MRVLALISAGSLALVACQHYPGTSAWGPAVEPSATDNVPVATRWTLDTAGEIQRNSITSVYLMICPKTQSKGTGFALKNGIIVTNEHVVHGTAVQISQDRGAGLAIHGPFGRGQAARADEVPGACCPD